MMTATEKAIDLAARIRSHLESNGVIQVTTYGRSTIYDGPKFVNAFRAAGRNVLVQRGRHWDSIATFYDGGAESGCSIRFGRWK